MFNFPLWPEQASTFASEYDLLFIVETAIMVFFATVVVVMLTIFGIKYRRGSKASRANPVHHHGPLEYGTILLLIPIALAAFAWAAKLYAVMYTPPADALEIFVIGKQWMWHIQHTNGVRENNELHVPLGRPVKLTMISQDVLHAFFVPAFRIKRDVVPGRFNDCWFTATRPGKFHLFCAEYCGTQHSEMGGWVYVMRPDEYTAWLARGGSRGPENGGPVPPVSMADKGRVLYDQLACGNCHDADGMQRGPILAGIFGKQIKLKNGKTVIADQDYLRKSIINPNEEIADPYQQIMPSYKGQLTEEQLLQVIAYIRSMGGQPNLNAEPEPATGTRAGAAAGSGAATVGAARPAAGAARPAAGTARPTAGTSRPATGTARPTAGTSRPATGAARPAAGAARPTAGGVKPAAIPSGAAIAPATPGRT